MKRISFLLVFLLVVLLVTPAFAREKEPIGDRILLYGMGDHDFPANTAFHVRQGWYEIEPWAAPGQVTFKLEVDGVQIKPTYVDYSTTFGEYSPYINKTYYFNFPDGMTGQHTFELHFIGPCWQALYWGLVTECANPEADFDWVYNAVVITFVP